MCVCVCVREREERDRETERQRDRDRERDSTCVQIYNIMQAWRKGAGWRSIGANGRSVPAILHKQHDSNTVAGDTAPAPG